MHLSFFFKPSSYQVMTFQIFATMNVYRAGSVTELGSKSPPPSRASEPAYYALCLDYYNPVEQAV